ncbi:MAG: NmrA family NAD(P)-binding protein, partial [Pseudomonas sp.]|uniref:NmrA family NAD(P)-binding protein n=1 Tax=Pseudomonas sp. TaxID=306 RepID=UPI003919BFBB
ADAVDIAPTVVGEVTLPDSLRRACAGVSHVVASAHSILGRGAERSALVDDQGHRDLIDAAKAAGVAHFCYVSAHGAAPDHPSAFLRIKYAVEQYLEASGLPYTIVRPTAFLQTHAYEMLGQPILEQGKATIFGKGTGRRNFVAVEDVATLIEAVWDDPQAVGQIIEIGGPAANSLTNNEVAAMFEQAAGRPAKISHVPRAVLRVMSPVLWPFHPGLSQVMAFALHDDLHDTTYAAAPLLRRYPLPLTRLDDWIAEHCVAPAAGRAGSPESVASAGAA